MPKTQATLCLRIFFLKCISTEVKKKIKSENAILLSLSQSTQLKDLPVYETLLMVVRR